MKKLIILFLPLIIFLGCTKTYNTPKYLGLHGKISLIKDSEYSVIYKFGEVIPDELIMVTTYSFDSRGNILKQILFDDEGDVYMSNENEYLKDQRITMKSTFGGGENFEVQNLIENIGNKSIWLISDQDNSEIGTMISDYDKSNKCWTYTFINGSDGTEVWKQEYFYNKKGFEIEEKLYNEGKLTIHSKTSYQNGFPHEIIFTYDNKESITSYVYPKFDKKGNWTERIEWVDGEPSKFITRDITYR